MEAAGRRPPRSLSLATGFGIASSSCSYAAVALARALFRKGAGLPAAMGVRDTRRPTWWSNWG